MVEDALLTSLASIRSRLTELKRDRTRFLTDHNVIELYSELTKVVKGIDPQALVENEAHRYALGDLALIFSLAFLTVGITRHTISTYSILLTIRTLLNYLTRELNYTAKELDVVSNRVKDAADIAEAGPSDPDLPYSPEIAVLIKHMIDRCQNELLPIVEKKVKSVPPSDQGVFSQIIHLRREILAVIVAPQFEAADLKALRDKVVKVNTHTDLASSSASLASKARETDDCEHDHHTLSEQINCCLQFCDWFANGPEVNDRVKPIYEQLRTMSRDLEMFLMTYRWTLRGTDLYQYMRNLQDLEKELCAITGLSTTGEDINTPIPKDITLCYYLVRKSWAMVYKLVDNAEPVSEALSPIYSQLLTMKRCLIEVNEMGGISNLRELYPYQMKLASIDDLRDDGKFVVNGEVPAGQGVLNALLAECYDLGDELKVDLEEREEEGLQRGDDEDSILEDEDQPDEPIEGTHPDLDSIDDHIVPVLTDDIKS